MQIFREEFFKKALSCTTKKCRIQHPTSNIQVFLCDRCLQLTADSYFKDRYLVSGVEEEENVKQNLTLYIYIYIIYNIYINI